MATLITEVSNRSDDNAVKLIPIKQGDIIDFKGCDIILATYEEVEDGEVLNRIEDKPVVQFKDGSLIGLSKLTTKWVYGKPTRTPIGELVTGRTKREVIAQLQKLGKWKCTARTEVVTTKGFKTKEYTFEKVEG